MFYVLLLLSIDKNVLFFRVLDTNYGIIHHRKYVCEQNMLSVFIFIKYEIVKKMQLFHFFQRLKDMASLVLKKKPYKSSNINYEVLHMSQCKEKNDNEYQIASKSESGFIKKRTFNDTRRFFVTLQR